MATKKKYNLGEIELGNEVYVSDPCYKIGTWCQKLLSGLKAGKYQGFMYKKDFGSLGIRVTDLWIAHENYVKNFPRTLVEDASIGVDSGGAGIYDKAYYEKYHKEGKDIDDDPESGAWYDRQFELRYCYDINGNEYIEPRWVEALIYNEDGSIKGLGKGHWEYSGQERRDGIALDNTCVTRLSGFGDGGYNLYVGKNSKGEIISVRIKFI